ncbi:MAG: hypothetical protein U0Y10_16345 [Spirosomataceae bacterium]
MPRRTFPSFLVYGFGLALALSLVFNAFLLFEQNRQQTHYENELRNSVNVAENELYHHQLSDCLRTMQQKDSLISSLKASLAHQKSSENK